MAAIKCLLHLLPTTGKYRVAASRALRFVIEEVTVSEIRSVYSVDE